MSGVGNCPWVANPATSTEKINRRMVGWYKWEARHRMYQRSCCGHGARLAPGGFAALPRLYASKSDMTASPSRIIGAVLLVGAALQALLWSRQWIYGDQYALLLPA